MDTKLKSDIAESAVATKLLTLGHRILKPVGDRLPYDLAVDYNGKLIRIQVKSAWHRNGVYTVDSRRTKTNRRKMVRARYEEGDFDFAILYLQDVDVFYVMPFDTFVSYRSGITLVENTTRQRPPKAWQYREAWELLRKWAGHPVTDDRNLSNSVKPSTYEVGGNTEPSLPIYWQEGVETRWQAPDSVRQKGEGIVQTTNLQQ